MNAREIAVNHQSAMELTERALEAQDPEHAQVLFRQAFESERKAAELLEQFYDQEPTRSVLYRSAASLALDCGERQEARRLLQQGLEGRPPADIAQELIELLQAMESSGRAPITMEFDSLRKIYIDDLKDLYSAEKQILQATLRMVKKASERQLKVVLEQNINQVREHIERLDHIFEALGKSSRGKKCKGMEGLIEDGKELMQEDMPPEEMDAVLISSAQKIDHYMIAGYGTVCTYARILGDNLAWNLLQRTLAEKKETSIQLAQVVTTSVNVSIGAEA
jgi:ferritin-like metal-binding protein YciE